MKNPGCSLREFSLFRLPGDGLSPFRLTAWRRYTEYVRVSIAYTGWVLYARLGLGLVGYTTLILDNTWSYWVQNLCTGHGRRW